MRYRVVACGMGAWGHWGMGQVAWAVSLECRAKPIENFIMVTTIFSQRNWHKNVVHELFASVRKTVTRTRSRENDKKILKILQKPVYWSCAQQKKRRELVAPNNAADTPTTNRSRELRPPFPSATELITFFAAASSCFSPPGPICNLNNMAAPAKYPNPGDKSTGKKKEEHDEEEEEAQSILY